MRVLQPLVLLLFCALTALAQAGDRTPPTTTPWAGASPTKSRLILESAEYAGEGVIRAGIQIKLEHGWWTYWRAPGASGMPPMFDYAGSENLADEPETIWPVPLRAVAYGEKVNVYRDEVVFPIEFRAADPAKPVKLRLKFTYGTCRNMCVPASADHELTITPTAGTPKLDHKNAKLIEAYSGRGPSSDPESVGIVIREVRAAVANGKVVLTIRARGVARGKRALLLVEGPDFTRVAEIEPSLIDDNGVAVLQITIGSTVQFKALKGKRIRITVVHGGRALEQVWVVGTQGSTVSGVGLTPVTSKTFGTKVYVLKIFSYKKFSLINCKKLNHQK
jgi:DsbC/DsbD-like thiol-disulfide interchange protein